MNSESWIEPFLKEARIGHLATSTRDGRPYLVPVCYAYDMKVFYSAIDEKRKRVDPSELRRVRNVKANSRVALVMDTYSENWEELQYVLVEGKAEIIQNDEERTYAIRLLRKKYSQYHSMKLGNHPMLRIIPSRIVGWRARG